MVMNHLLGFDLFSRRLGEGRGNQNDLSRCKSANFYSLLNQ